MYNLRRICEHVRVVRGCFLLCMFCWKLPILTKINHQEENSKIQTMHGQMHGTHWGNVMYKVTHDLNITGSGLLVGTSYDKLNHIGIQVTLHFCKQD